MYRWNWTLGVAVFHYQHGTFIKRPESFEAGFIRHKFVEMRKYLLTLELNFNRYRVYYWITPIHSHENVFSIGTVPLRHILRQFHNICHGSGFLCTVHSKAKAAATLFIIYYDIYVPNRHSFFHMLI